MAILTAPRVVLLPYPHARARQAIVARARPAIVPRVPVDFARRYHDARGKYRVFNTAGYRFYRSSSAPPAEGDTPFATNATLPHTPADVYADGTWYLAVSYFNGAVDSGFLPVGPNGETYLRLDLAGGVETISPPNAANDVQLVDVSGGVAKVLAFYFQIGTLRAEEWAIVYTIDGSDPPEDTPDATEAMPATGLCILDYDLPAQAHGVVVKARVQTRRDDGSWVYSEGSSILTVTIDTSGPAVPEGMEAYPGRMPENA